MAVPAIVVGLVLLTIGAELVVRGGSRLAAIAGVSPLVVGLTVVAIGTSAPELAVGIDSARQGVGELALGNIAGTNIVNTLLILGLVASIAALPLQSRVPHVDLPVMVVSATVLLLMSLDGRLTAVEGALLLVGDIAYTVLVVHTSRRESVAVETEYADEFGEPTARRSTGQRGVKVLGAQFGIVVVGLAIIVIGADRLVSGAVGVAGALGVSDAFIGLTVVAIGTSAPELATAVVASVRHERDIAVGNLFGSSIYNILVILGVTILASPGGLTVSPDLVRFDLPVMLGVSILCIPIFLTGRRVSRPEGVALMALYVLYLGAVIVIELT